MPALVVLQYKTNEYIREAMVFELAKTLPKIIADAFHVEWKADLKNPDGRLEPRDVEVWVQESGRFDVNTKNIGIIIWISPHPERLANLEQRKKAITQAVRIFLYGHDDAFSSLKATGSLLVLLQQEARGDL